VIRKHSLNNVTSYSGLPLKNWYLYKGQNLTFFGRTPKMMCVHYSNTTKLLSKDVFSPYSTRCSGLMSILNNIEIRTPSLESRALYRIKKTHVHSIDPSLAKPWQIWRGCSYKNLISKTRLLTSPLLQSPKMTFARSNMKFSRSTQHDAISRSSHWWLWDTLLRDTKLSMLWD